MRRGTRVAALSRLGVSAVWASSEPKGGWVVANPNAVSSQRPRGLRVWRESFAGTAERRASAPAYLQVKEGA